MARTSPVRINTLSPLKPLVGFSQEAAIDRTLTPPFGSLAPIAKPKDGTPALLDFDLRRVCRTDPLVARPQAKALLTVFGGNLSHSHLVPLCAAHAVLAVSTAYIWPFL